MVSVKLVANNLTNMKTFLNINGGFIIGMLCEYLYRVEFSWWAVGFITYKVIFLLIINLTDWYMNRQAYNKCEINMDDL